MYNFTQLNRFLATTRAGTCTSKLEHTSTGTIVECKLTHFFAFLARDTGRASAC